MERFITDKIYDNRKFSKSSTLELEQKRLYKKLATLISEEDANFARPV